MYTIGHAWTYGDFFWHLRMNSVFFSWQIFDWIIGRRFDSTKLPTLFRTGELHHNHVTLHKWRWCRQNANWISNVEGTWNYVCGTHTWLPHSIDVACMCGNLSWRASAASAASVFGDIDIGGVELRCQWMVRAQINPVWGVPSLNLFLSVEKVEYKGWGWIWLT